MIWLSLVVLLIAVVGCAYLVAAAILVHRFTRIRASALPASMPAVTVLKPLDGDEPGLLDNLASFCRQDYRGPIQIVLGVQDPNDPAIAVVKELRRAEPTCDLDLVVDSSLHGMNRKVSNLVNMAPRIARDVVVLADSDMRVERDYLGRVIAALETPDVGAVTCLYYGVAATGIWSQFSALAINAQFLPSVVVAMALRLAHPCFGSTIALKRQTLEAIGGFKAFADSLADDYAIGQALRARGCTISVPPFAIAHMCTATSLGALWRHELRWARTIRSIDPLGYAGSMAGHPLAWALIAALVGAGSAAFVPAIGLILASLTCRIALLRQVERGFGLPAQAYWLVPVRDLLSFAVFVLSFLGRDVSWRGRRYRMGPGGGWAADRGSD